MDGRHGPAGEDRRYAPGRAARLITLYAEPARGFSGMTVLVAKLDVLLVTGDGCGRLAHPLLGLAPQIESARVLKVELNSPGEVRVRLM